VRVQYFERVRLEMHFERNTTHILIGLLGTALLLETPSLQVHATPMPSLERVASATTSYKGAGAAKRTNIARAGAMIDGTIIPAGSEFSFLASSNFADTDFVEGYGIINGQLVTIIGGGLCQVSTTVFRAASNGGFDITRRIPHTFVVTTYEDILGFDATVLDPSVDFRFRNDSAHLLMVVVRNNPAAATFTIELWGVPDGRTVSYDGPYVTNVTKPGVAVWQYDASLRNGTTRQLVYGRGGMKVSYMRKVFAADGTVIHDDTYLTTYAPWYDYVLYGPGVVPPAGVRLR
jgi:vancomycin resistance protein YoaR